MKKNLDQYTRQSCNYKFSFICENLCKIKKWELYTKVPLNIFKFFSNFPYAHYNTIISFQICCLCVIQSSMIMCLCCAILDKKLD